MTETGVIYTYTIVRSAAEAFKHRTPYLVAVVTRPDGSRVASLVQGWTENAPVQIGSAVELAGSDALGNPIHRIAAS